MPSWSNVSWWSAEPWLLSYILELAFKNIASGIGKNAQAVRTPFDELPLVQRPVGTLVGAGSGELALVKTAFVYLPMSRDPE